MAAPKKKPKPAVAKPAPKPAKKPAAKPAKPVPAEWQAIVATLTANPGVTRRGMFGADGIGLNRKYFAMSWKGYLIVKLPPARIEALVAAKVGKYFDPDPSMGGPMKTWLHVTAKADWSKLVEEGLAYCASQQE